MSQITQGFRKILSHSLVYGIFQNLMGAQNLRNKIINEYVCPTQKSKILDIGCGPAEILEFMPNISYWGIDLSENYIEQAKKKFGNRGNFLCSSVDDLVHMDLPKFDIAMALGVLHHLDDKTASDMLSVVSGLIRPGGKFVSFDPCFDKNQNIIARYIIKYDRGQNVRTAEQYQHLVSPVFKSVSGKIDHQAFVPYTRYIMECII